MFFLRNLITPIIVFLFLSGCQERETGNSTFPQHGTANIDRRINQPRPSSSFRTISAAAFSKDNECLLTGYQVTPGRPASFDETQTIDQWEVKTGKKVRGLQGHKRGVTSLDFLPNGKEAVSCGVDGIAIVWDLTKGEEIRTIRVNEGHTLIGALSPNGDRLVTWGVDASGNVLFDLWDVSTGKLIQGFPGEVWTVRSLGLSPGGALVVLGCVRTPSDEGGVKLFDTRKGKLIRAFSGHYARDWAISPNGKWLALERWETLFSAEELIIWDISMDKELKHLDTHSESVTVKAFTSDGNRLMAIKNPKSAAVFWDVATGVETEPEKPVEALFAFSPDGQLGLTAKGIDAKGQFTSNERMSLEIWNLSSGERIRQLPSNQE